MSNKKFKNLNDKSAIFRILFSFLCIVSIFSFFTCQAGLGNQVDTRSPSVAVVSPATKSILNSNFTMTGTASDDLAVASVTVTFKDISSSKTYGPFTATLSGSTWSLSVSVGGANSSASSSSSVLADGDYNVTISASDNSGHVSTADIVYTVDTTSPTVLLTSPTTYVTTPQFSKTVTVKGEVYDATTLSSVYVYIYDYEGNVVASTLAEGTNTFIATFSSPNLKNYDSTSEETRVATTYYYAAVATDAGGNKNTYDFHRCDIASLVASHVDEGATFPSINALGSLDQGTATSITGGITADEVETKQLILPTTDNASSILSEKSYPDLRYTSTSNGSITWLNVTEKPEDDTEAVETTYKSIAPEASVTGTVNASIDGSAQSGFRVWVKKLDSLENGCFDTDGDGIEDIVYDEDGDGTGDYEVSVSESSDDTGNYQAYFTSDGSGFSFVINSGDGSSTTTWQTGYWWVKIYYVTDTGGYGEGEAVFNVQSGTPQINEVGFAGEDNINATNYTGYTNSSSITFSGTATNSDGTGNADSVTIKYKKTGDTTYTSLEVFYNTSTYVYSATFTPQSEDTYSFVLTASVGDYNTTIYRTVVYDATGPVIEVKSIKPSIDIENDDEDESYYVNGEITAVFTISDDDQISSATYEVVTLDEDGAVEDTIARGSYSTAVKKITISGIDTTLFVETIGDEQTTLANFITITATDRCGNTTVFGRESTSDDETELSSYLVSQESDRPTLTTDLEELDSRSEAICDSDGTEHNIFKKTESLSLALADDDGLEAVYVLIDGDTDEDATWSSDNFTNADFTSEPTSKTVKYSLSNLSYGSHSIKFRVEDINYESDDSSSSSYTPYSYYETDYYYLTIDAGVPTMNISTLQNQNVASSFTLTGTAKDENEIEKIEFISYGTDSDTGESDETLHTFYTVTPGDDDDTTSDWSWSVTYDLESTDNEAGIQPYPADITVKVTDTIGRTATSTFSYYYDSTAPEMPVLVNDEAALFYGLFLEKYVADTKNSLTITGSVSDTGSGTSKSGISSVQWGLITGEVTHTSAVCIQTLAGYAAGDGSGCTYFDTLYALSQSSPSTSIDQGYMFDDWYYYPYTTDSTYVYYFCYHYDDEKVENILALIDGEDEEGETVNSYVDSDSVTHTRKVEWTDATLTANTAESATYDYDWKIYTAFPEFDDGKYTIVIRSVDKVGNTSYPLIHCIVADNTAPTLTGVLTDSDTGDATISSDTTGTLYTNDTTTLTGIVSDDNPLIISSGLEYVRSTADSSYQNELSLVVTCTDSSGNEVSGTLTIDEDGSGTDYTADTIANKYAYAWIAESTVSWGEDTTWYWTFDETPDEDVYTVTIIAKDKAYYTNTPTLNSTTITRSVVVDSTSPTITISSVTPLIEYEADDGEKHDTVNGDTTVKVLVQDSYISAAYVTYACKGTYGEDGDEDISATWEEADSEDGDLYGNWTGFSSSQLVSGWSGTLDTTSSNYYYTDEDTGITYLSLAFKAVDKSGNVTYKQVNYVVDQDSDIPTINSTTLSVLDDADDAGYADDENNTATNVLTSSNKVITFNLTDDDGLQYVYIAHGEVISESTEWTLAETLDGSTSKTWSYSAPDSYFTTGNYGRYLLNFKVVDVNGTADTSSAIYSTYVATDKGAPVLTFDSTSSYVPQSLTLSGTATDENGLAKVKVIYGSGDSDYTEVDLSSETAGSEVSWKTDSFTLTNTSGTLYIYAYDKIGHKTVKTIDYTVDTTPPVLTLDDDDEDDGTAYVDYGYIDVDQTLRITGILTDPSEVDGSSVEQSGIYGVKYEITTSSTHDDWTDDTGSDAYTFDTSTGAFTVIPNFTDTSTKNWYVHIAGRDIAGNWSNIGCAKVSLDTENPETSIAAYIDSGETLSGSTIFNESVTFKGTATDDADLKSITAYNYNSGSIDEDSIIGEAVELSGTSADWEIEFEIDEDEHADDGTYVILFRVVDSSGKSTDYSRTYKIDTEAPTISFDSIEDITSSRASAQRVTLLYSDTVSALYSYEYKFQWSTDVGETWSDFADSGFDDADQASGTVTDLNSMSGTIILSLSAFLDSPDTDALWRLEITATDNAGNKETYTSDSFWVDSTKPTMANTTTLGSVVSIDDSFSMSGYIYDSGYGQVDKVVASIYNASYSSELKEEFTQTFTTDDDGGLTWDSTNDYYTFTWEYESSESPFQYDGTYTITLLGYDKAGNEKELTFTTACDNDPPQMSFTKPYAMAVDSSSKHSVTTGNTTDVMGTVTIVGSIPADGEDGGMGQIYYQLGTSGAITLYDSNGDELDLDISTGFENDEEIAKVVFNNEAALSDSTNYTSGDVQGYWKNTGGTTNYNWSFEFTALNVVNNGWADERDDDGDGEPDEDLYTTYVYVVAQDLAGNINVAIYPINIDIDTDKPTVTILSPDPEADENEYGGAFTVMGSVTSDDGIAGVYMQVEVVDGNYVDGVLTSTVDSEAFPGDYSSGWYNLGTAQKDYDGTSETVTAYFTGVGDEAGDVGSKGAYTNLNYWYKVNSGANDGTWDSYKTSTSANWKLKINNKKVSLDGETGNAVWDDSGSYYIFDNIALKNYYTSTHSYSASDQTELIIRVVALDYKNDDNDGTASTTAVFGEVQEVTVYINAGAPNIDITEMPNSDDYVTGTFDYAITLSDDGYISSYSVVAAGSSGTYTIASASDLTTKGEISLTGTVDSSVLETNCGNTVTITVTATDNSSPSVTSTQTRKFYIDNTSPTFQYAKVSGKTYTGYYLVPDAVDSGNLRDDDGNMRILGEEAVINGWVKDESNGSGIDYVMIWFSQGSGTSTKIFSVAGYDEETEVDEDGSAYSGTATLVDEDDEDVTVYLPVASLDDVDRNAGGITYSSGEYSSGTRTPYMIIDVAEVGVDYGANGDYDGYSENIATTGIWYCAFNSLMIKDEIYDVNYVVVDIAGNARYFKDSMFVMNHAPVIECFDLTTDLRALNKLSDEDEVEYNPGSEVTTNFKSVNYLFSFGFEVDGDNVTDDNPLTYYLTYTASGASESTTVSSEDLGTWTEDDFDIDDTTTHGIFWDSTNNAFVFAGSGCQALSSSGTMTYTVYVKDYLGLSSDSYDFSVDMANEDETKPVAQFLPFNTTAYSSLTDDAWTTAFDAETITYGSYDSSIGHIEPRSTLVYNTTDSPTLSGKVWIRGQVLDDQRITSIIIKMDDGSTNGLSYTVAEWDDDEGTLVAQNSTSGTTELHQVLGQKGHFVEFAYLWDSTDVSGNAKLGVDMSLAIVDGSSNSSTASSYTTENTARNADDCFDLDDWGYNETAIDVRPYITSMTAATAASSSSYTARSNSVRSRLGAVPVQSGDYIVIDGFNLSTNFYRQLASNVSTTTVATSITGTAITANESYYISAPTYSGYIIAATNGVYSYNNWNADSEYNYEQTSNSTNTYDSENDTSLDHYFDDRYVQVWQTSSTVGTNRYKNSEDPIGPAIANNGSDIYGGWGSGASYVYVYKNAATSTIAKSGFRDPISQFDLVMNGTTPYYLCLDNWQSGDSSWGGDGLAFLPTAGQTSITSQCIERQGNGNASSPVHTDGIDEVQNQFYNPRAAIRTDGTYVYAYTSYYDRYAKCLKYGEVTFSGTTYKSKVTTSQNPTNGYCVVDGLDSCESSLTEPDVNIGKYSDIGFANSSGYPVIAYSDETNGTLKIARAKSSATPKNTSGYAIRTDSNSSPSAADAWYYTTIDKTSSDILLGKYVSMEVDSNYGLHIATQDSNNGDLYYLYLTWDSTNNVYKEQCCVLVDSANSVGKWTDIKLTVPSASGLLAYPVISYVDGTNQETVKGIRAAFVSSASSATAGTWEHMMVPCVSATEDARTTLAMNGTTGVTDGGSKTSRFCIGYKSSYLDTVFLRGEE